MRQFASILRRYIVQVLNGMKKMPTDLLKFMRLFIKPFGYGSSVKTFIAFLPILHSYQTQPVYAVCVCVCY